MGPVEFVSQDCKKSLFAKRCRRSFSAGGRTSLMLSNMEPWSTRPVSEKEDTD